MKTTTLIVGTCWLVAACQSAEQAKSDKKATSVEGNYTIVDFESLPKQKQEEMNDSFFVSPPEPDLHALSETKPISISEAQGFVTLYSNLTSNRFLKEVPGNPGLLARIPLRKIMHSNISSDKNYMFPSYAVDVEKLHKYVIKNRGGMYKDVKYLRIYPAMKKIDNKRVFTLVLVGLDDNYNFVLKKGKDNSVGNFILEYIDPCKPPCKNVGEN